MGNSPGCRRPPWGDDGPVHCRTLRRAPRTMDDGVAAGNVFQCRAVAEWDPPHWERVIAGLFVRRGMSVEQSAEALQRHFGPMDSERCCTRRDAEGSVATHEPTAPARPSTFPFRRTNTPLPRASIKTTVEGISPQFPRPCHVLSLTMRGLACQNALRRIKSTCSLHGAGHA